MYMLDANIFVRDLDTRSAHYAPCHALLERLQQTSIPVIEPLIVLVEVAGSVSRELHNPMRGRVYVDILRAFPHIQFIAVDDNLAQAATEIAADYALRGMDAIYVALARQHSCILVTLDDKIGRRAGSVVTVQTPAAALAALDARP